MLPLDGVYYPVQVHYDGQERTVLLRGHMTVLGALARCCRAFGLPDEAWMVDYSLAQHAEGPALREGLALFDLPGEERVLYLIPARRQETLHP